MEEKLTPTVTEEWKSIAEKKQPDISFRIGDLEAGRLRIEIYALSPST